MGLNYEAPDQPRYVGGHLTKPRTSNGTEDTLRIVTFNIAFAKQVDSAIVVLTQEPDLRSADIVLLQEMDEAGTRRIADALGAAYVYYPASRYNKTGRDFGNAVVSRWPIIDDDKLVLPHRGFLAHTRRNAVGVTVRVGTSDVRVYSAHLGTIVNTLPAHRREQLETILDDAEKYTHVIIGGDMNSSKVGNVATGRGYSWPTREGPRTTEGGRFDHIFLKGLDVVQPHGTGTVRNIRKASDHKPVWLLVVAR